MTLGIGLFSLPYYFSKIGLYPGILMIIIAGLLNYYTCWLMFKLSSITKKKSFLGCVKVLLPNWVYNISKFTVGVSLFVMFIFYGIAAYNLLQFLLFFAGVLDKDDLINPEKL